MGLLPMVSAAWFLPAEVWVGRQHDPHTPFTQLCGVATASWILTNLQRSKTEEPQTQTEAHKRRGSPQASQLTED